MFAANRRVKIKVIIKSAKKVCIVADSSKFLKDVLVSFGEINISDEIITSGDFI
ncbi:hypothetical protein ACAG39_04435 [Caldicellulosiruptoraceae bacterium PP1]